MTPRSLVRSPRLLLGSLLVAGALALAGGVAPAGAASGGAGAPDVPVANGGGTPSGQAILCTLSIPAAGGSATCSNVTVTAGATTDGLSVVISDGAGPSCAVGQAIGVSFVDPVSNQPSTLPQPATVTATNGAISGSDSVLVFDAATDSWVLPPSGGVSGGSSGAGSVSATLTGNASFVADAASCSSAIAGATVAVTGKPFLGEELLAGVLVAGGGLVLVLALRRRRPAHG